MSPGPFVIGWEEWVALPDLGLPAIKAKVDTGAKTSALHAITIEPFGTAAGPEVRFVIHPVPGREDIEVVSTAPVIDRREVASSNGERELRYVIATRVAMGGRSWPIELTLTNRETMSYRMLLGRQAIREDMFVDASSSFRQPRLSHKLYRPVPGSGAGRRGGLEIAILTRKGLSPSCRHLVEAAAFAGHRARPVDPASLAIALKPGRTHLVPDGAPLPRFDAVIPRTGPGPFSAALVRALERSGTLSLNTSAALDRLRNPLATLETLALAGVPLAVSRLDAAGWSDAWRAAQERMPRLSVLVVGERALRAIWLRDGEPAPVALDALGPERAVAEQTARALALGLCAVDLAPDDAGRLCIAAITPAPLLGPFERGRQGRIAPDIIAAVESIAKSQP